MVDYRRELYEGSFQGKVVKLESFGAFVEIISAGIEWL